MTARAEAAAETRRRIVAAAVVVYARDGFKNASMQSIARQARVAPTTVLNHFSTPDVLVAAAVELLINGIQLPKPAEIESLSRVEDRLTKIARDLATCFERSAHWYVVYARDRDMPVLRKGSVAFLREVQALIRTALGPGLRDKRTVSVASVLLGAETIGALRAGGMSSKAAADAMAEVLLSWLRRKRDVRSLRSR